ncbi:MULTISPECIES: hypothetical protein [Larkinella]|jgi:hypothetical protein|uniref:Uncharacterized protein n=1 Tax=Larkinella humicola TaxID=2607654 RepID=A0A5N1JMS6_9BACT|nr:MULTISPECIES: hypothetical protein [Larkinella]KAA9356876.1 hypothetical protein F0P93_03810 [Larkinella humicola]
MKTLLLYSVLIFAQPDTVPPTDTTHYYDPVQARVQEDLQAQKNAWKPMEKRISRVIWVFIGVVGTWTLVVITRRGLR